MVDVREDDVGMSWARRYASLRLNTPRGLSYMPGYRIPREAGRWPSRDDMVAYLRTYRERMGLRVRFGTEAKRIDRRKDGWLVTTTGGEIRARFVVVATGHDARPVVPDWPGRERFPGTQLHSSQYIEPAPFRGKQILVVSISNSGADIALELAHKGAAHVWAAMRAPPPVLPRERFGIALMYTAFPANPLPDRFGDFAAARMQRTIYGDLSAYGIPPAVPGVQTRARRLHKSILVEGGFVDALKTGRIEIVPALERFDGAEAVLADGTRLGPDVVIAATGYSPNLSELVGHLGVLDAQGYPAVRQGHDHPAARGLFFSGYWASIIGQLLHIRRDGLRIAKRIAARAPDVVRASS